MLRRRTALPLGSVCVEERTCITSGAEEAGSVGGAGCERAPRVRRRAAAYVSARARRIIREEGGAKGSGGTCGRCRERAERGTAWGRENRCYADRRALRWRLFYDPSFSSFSALCSHEESACGGASTRLAATEVAATDRVTAALRNRMLIIEIERVFCRATKSSEPR